MDARFAVLVASAGSYVAVWLLYLTSPARRSLRSVLFLLITSLPLAPAAVLPPPYDLLLAAPVAAVWILGLMDFGHLLAPMEPVEVRFDQRLGAIQRRVRRSEAQIRPDTWNADRERHQEILAGALAEARGNQITTSATSMTVTLAREY